MNWRKCAPPADGFRKAPPSHDLTKLAARKNKVLRQTQDERRWSAVSKSVDEIRFPFLHEGHHCFDLVRRAGNLVLAHRFHH